MIERPDANLDRLLVVIQPASPPLAYTKAQSVSILRRGAIRYLTATSNITRRWSDYFDRDFEPTRFPDNETADCCKKDGAMSRANIARTAKSRSWGRLLGVIASEVTCCETVGPRIDAVEAMTTSLASA